MEMVAIRKILIIRAANQAMAFSIPTLAAVLSFVTYGATRDSLDPVGAGLRFFHRAGAAESVRL